MSKIDLSSIQCKRAPIPEKPIKPPPKPKQPVKKPDILLSDILGSGKTREPITKPIEPAIETPAIETPPIDRMKQIKVLELYRLEFPEKLVAYKNKKFDKCTDQQLIDIRKDMDFTLTSNSNLTIGLEMAEKALFVYEYIATNYAGLEIQGIGELSKADEWKDNVKALCLKYISNPITTVSPENKLMFMIVTHSILLHQVNSANKAAKVTEEVKQDIIISKPEETEKEDDIVTKLRLQEVNRKYEDL